MNASADLLYNDATNLQLESADGTNTGVKALTTTNGTKVQAALAYGGSTMKLNADGTWGSEATYDGAYAFGSPVTLSILRSSTYAIQMRDLRRYDGTYADVQTTLDTLLP